MKLLPLSILTLLLCLSTGCSTTTSLGDQMVDQGKAAKKIGKQWKKGSKMVEKGKKYLAESEKLSTEGQQLVEQGRKLMSKNEAAYDRAFADSDSE